MDRFRLVLGVCVLALAATLSLPTVSSADPPAPGITGTASYPPLPAPTYTTVAENVSVTMDDGVKIGATVTFPSLDGKTPAAGQFPVVLSITPYGRTLLCSCPEQKAFATRGMIGVVADTRGTGGSTGNLNENYFSPREARDGYQLVEHFGTQSYSNGKVGMAGGSYVGITQYLTAEQQPPHLAAIVPQVALADLYRDAFTHGGIPNVFFDAQYLGVQGGPGLVTPGGTDQVPMTVEAKIGQLLSTPIALAYLANPLDGPYYRDRSPIYDADKITVPVLILDGWRDGFVRGSVEMYRALAQRPNVETRLYIDGCTHKGCGAPFAPTLNPAGMDDLTAMSFEFLRRHLLGEPQGERAKVRTYVQPDTGTYIESDSWPPTRSDFLTFTLQNGTLTDGPAVGTRTKSYVTNPLAGITSPLDQYGTVAISPYVPTDQRLAGFSGLTWKTPVFSSARTIAGPTQLHLVASSSAKDTDWVAKLSDVAPDGTESIISEGYLRASQREVDPSRSSAGSPYHTHDAVQPLTPGKFYAYDIGIWPTAYKVEAGHRLSMRLTTYDVPTHAPASVKLDINDLSKTALNLVLPSVNTVREGGTDPSTLQVPVYGE